MNALRVTQWTALGVGAVLLGWFFFARSQSSVNSRAALEEFRRARAIAVEAHEPNMFRSWPARSAPVETSLWSEGRIEAYRRTLFSESRTPIAVLSVPSVDIEVPVFDGTDDWVLDRGAGRIEGTATPGGTGNIGIAGHRDGFFRPLKDIAIGDALVLETVEGSREFRVQSLEVVDPSNISVLAPTEEPVITLVTCYPFYFVGSAPKRFIVRAVSDRTGDFESPREP